MGVNNEIQFVIQATLKYEKNMKHTVFKLVWFVHTIGPLSRFLLIGNLRPEFERAS